MHVITKDVTDNLFLSIALEGGCTAIVSGDHHLLDLRHYQQIRIVPAATFVPPSSQISIQLSHRLSSRTETAAEASTPETLVYAPKSLTRTV